MTAKCLLTNITHDHQRSTKSGTVKSIDCVWFSRGFLSLLSTGHEQPPALSYVNVVLGAQEEILMSPPVLSACAIVNLLMEHQMLSRHPSGNR
jgi:hypothetical protein